MTGLPRLLDNPDRMGCWVLQRTLHLDAAQAKLSEFSHDGDGVTMSQPIHAPCAEELPPVAIDPIRQQMITTLAATAFLESRFAPDPTARAHALGYLTEPLPRDFNEVSVATTAKAQSPARGVDQ